MPSAGDEDEDESGEERLPFLLWLRHALPHGLLEGAVCLRAPTEYCHGWACFVVSILIIGMLPAIIGGPWPPTSATIGLKDSVTAVIFVAFGTSVPGESEGGFD